MMDEDHLEAILNLKKEFKARCQSDKKKIADMVVETPEDFKRGCRLRYIEDLMTDRIVKVWKQMERYEDYCRRDRVIERLLTGEQIETLVKEIMKLQNEGIALKHPEEVNDRRVREDMIHRAKEHPFTELLEFKRNQARCPFHKDRNPSMHLYAADNRVHCFSCGKGYDTIGFIMKRDGMTFQDAVRQLQ